MVEALAALPVLILLLVAGSFVRERYTAEQTALGEARRCAFLHASAGCAEVPPGCERALRGPHSVPDLHGEAIVRATREAQPATGFDVLEDIPVLGAALAGLFGTSTSAETSGRVRIPWKQDAYVVPQGALSLLCNERPKDVLEAAKEALCSADALAVVKDLPLCD